RGRGGGDRRLVSERVVGVGGRVGGEPAAVRARIRAGTRRGGERVGGDTDGRHSLGDLPVAVVTGQGLLPVGVGDERRLVVGVVGVDGLVVDLRRGRHLVGRAGTGRGAARVAVRCDHRGAVAVGVVAVGGGAGSDRAARLADSGLGQVAVVVVAVAGCV